MNPTCPLCDPVRRGYVIRFGTKLERDTVAQAFLSKDRQQWQEIDNGSLWCATSLVYDAAQYWMDFFNPNAWQFAEAEFQTNGQLEVGNAIQWQSVLASKPAVWIDTVIREQSIRMMYQPIVNPHNHAIIGYEMLARVKADENGSFHPPNLVFDAARVQNELFRLDRTCRIEALHAAQKVPEPQAIFINFIPTSIYNPEHCLQSTMQASRQFGIDRKRVVFEVVETDKVDDIQHLKSILRFYRKQGFRYALDDVGEGFNDLGTLAQLEPDVVKLDRKFVHNIHLDNEKRKRAQEILSLGQSMQAKVIAEGVEREEEAHVLREMGFDWLQGYFYGRPAWSPDPVIWG